MVYLTCGVCMSFPFAGRLEDDSPEGDTRGTVIKPCKIFDRHNNTITTIRYFIRPVVSVTMRARVPYSETIVLKHARGGHQSLSPGGGSLKISPRSSRAMCL